LTSTSDPKRGEIWYVNLDPTQGDEIRKTRPCAVLSSDALGTLNLKLIVPLTGWQEGFRFNGWLARLDPTPENGLSKPSAADVFQIRSVSLLRFGSYIGTIEDADMQRITTALANLVEYVPPSTP
jgi:mRNA interferase MazF